MAELKPRRKKKDHENHPQDRDQITLVSTGVDWIVSCSMMVQQVVEKRLWDLLRAFSLVLRVSVYLETEAWSPRDLQKAGVGEKMFMAASLQNQ
jgi:hypothetical protein